MTDTTFTPAQQLAIDTCRKNGGAAGFERLCNAGVDARNCRRIMRKLVDADVVVEEYPDVWRIVWDNAGAHVERFPEPTRRTILDAFDRVTDAGWRICGMQYDANERITWHLVLPADAPGGRATKISVGINLDQHDRLVERSSMHPAADVVCPWVEPETDDEPEPVEFDPEPDDEPVEPDVDNPVHVAALLSRSGIDADLAAEHDALVHPDGGECPDGVRDAAPVDLEITAHPMPQITGPDVDDPDEARALASALAFISSYLHAPFGSERRQRLTHDQRHAILVVLTGDHGPAPAGPVVATASQISNAALAVRSMILRKRSNVDALLPETASIKRVGTGFEITGASGRAALRPHSAGFVVLDASGDYPLLAVIDDLVGAVARVVEHIGDDPQTVIDVYAGENDPRNDAPEHVLEAQDRHVGAPQAEDKTPSRVEQLVAGARSIVEEFGITVELDEPAVDPATVDAWPKFVIFKHARHYLGALAAPDAPTDSGELQAGCAAALGCAESTARTQLTRLISVGWAARDGRGGDVTITDAGRAVAAYCAENDRAPRQQRSKPKRGRPGKPTRKRAAARLAAVDELLRVDWRTDERFAGDVDAYHAAIRAAVAS